MAIFENLIIPFPKSEKVFSNFKIKFLYTISSNGINNTSQNHHHHHNTTNHHHKSSNNTSSNGRKRGGGESTTLSSSNNMNTKFLYNVIKAKRDSFTRKTAGGEEEVRVI